MTNKRKMRWNREDEEKGEEEMNREEIIRMAREAGWTEYSLLHPVEVQRLECFAALVAAAEREACAKVADEVGDDDEDCHAWTAADAIRARGKE